jgi:hypothetical protein
MNSRQHSIAGRYVRTLENYYADAGDAACAVIENELHIA